MGPGKLLLVFNDFVNLSADPPVPFSLLIPGAVLPALSPQPPYQPLGWSYRYHLQATASAADPSRTWCLGSLML